MSGTTARLVVEGLSGELEVHRMRGREELSALSRFELVTTMSSETDVGALVGSAARFELSVGGHTRAIHGLVWRTERGEALSGGRQRIHLSLSPRARKLTLRRQSRVFQSQTSVDIAKVIFGEHNVPFASVIKHPLIKREVCIQRDETDLQLIRRLFAEDGLVFRIDAPSGTTADAGETLVVFDDTSQYQDVAASTVLVYRPAVAGAGMQANEDDVFRFTEHRQRGPHAVHARGYDYRRPQKQHLSGKPGVEAIVEDHGPYGEMQPELQPLETLLDQVTRGQLLFEGRTGCARLSPGACYSLEQHALAPLDGAYAVAQISHRLRSAEGDGDLSYENELVTVPADVLRRPARPRRKARQSMETAIVVGPDHEEVHTDDLGRIKVCFHWDLEPPNEFSSCWIRVAQAWAGSRYGAQFIPRVGMEVMVAFLGGDPDRPVVVGCLPNGTHPPAFALPAEKTRSGFRTAPSPFHPDGVLNELSFQDAAGAEEVRVVARRDMNVAIARNRTQVVSGADSTTVARDQHIVVEGARTLRIAGDETTDFGSSVETKVAGDRSEEVRGKARLRVEQHSALDIGGDREIKVRSSSRTTVDGPWADHARSNYSLTVGDHGAVGTATTIVRGSASHSVDQRSTFTAEEELIVQCGESRIVLTPTAIKISSPSIVLEASDIKATGDGPQLRLNKKAEIISDEVAIRAESSSLVLDKSATVRGEAIKLAKAEPPPQNLADDPAEGTIRLVARLSNEKFEPYASKRYELRAGDAKREGTTDGDGILREDLPEDATVARVELWTEDFPKGPRNTYTIKVAPLPPIDELPGIRARLNNLGYPPGPIDEPDMDPATQSALESFQTDNDLLRTGEADAETQQALLAKHGH